MTTESGDHRAVSVVSAELEALIRWGTTPPSRGWLTIDGAQREALAAAEDATWD